MNLIYPVEGSGSHSLLKVIPNSEIQHCDVPVDFALYSEIHTTRRDPVHVGATWGNRYGRNLGDHPRTDVYARWRDQWSSWALYKDQMHIHEMEDLPHENPTDDRVGLKKAVEDEDWGFYHRFVPQYFIDFARPLWLS